MPTNTFDILRRQNPELEHDNVAALREQFYAPVPTWEEQFDRDTQGQDFKRGLVSSVLNQQAGDYFTQADDAQAAGDVESATVLRDYGIRKQEQAAQVSPRVSSYSQAENVSDVIDYLQGGAGQVASSMLPPFAAGIGGSVAAAGLAAAAPVSIPLGLAATAGGLAGAAGASYPLISGEIASSQQADPFIREQVPVEQRVEERKRSALKQTAFEALIPGGLVSGQLVGRAAKRIANQALRKGPLRRTATVAEGIAGESGTELLQTRETQASLSRLNPNRDTTHDYIEQIDAIILGALGGGTLTLGTTLPGYAVSKLGGKGDRRVREYLDSTLAEDVETTGQVTLPDENLYSRQGLPGFPGRKEKKTGQSLFQQLLEKTRNIKSDFEQLLDKPITSREKRDFRQRLRQPILELTQEEDKTVPPEVGKTVTLFLKAIKNAPDPQAPNIVRAKKALAQLKKKYGVTSVSGLLPAGATLSRFDDRTNTFIPYEETAEDVAQGARQAIEILERKHLYNPKLVKSAEKYLLDKQQQYGTASVMDLLQLSDQETEAAIDETVEVAPEGPVQGTLPLEEPGKLLPIEQERLFGPNGLLESLSDPKYLAKQRSTREGRARLKTDREEALRLLDEHYPGALAKYAEDRRNKVPKSTRRLKREAYEVPTPDTALEGDALFDRIDELAAEFEVAPPFGGQIQEAPETIISNESPIEQGLANTKPTQELQELQKISKAQTKGQRTPLRAEEVAGLLKRLVKEKRITQRVADTAVTQPLGDYLLDKNVGLSREQKQIALTNEVNAIRRDIERRIEDQLGRIKSDRDPGRVMAQIADLRLLQLKNISSSKTARQKLNEYVMVLASAADTSVASDQTQKDARRILDKSTEEAQKDIEKRTVRLITQKNKPVLVTTDDLANIGWRENPAMGKVHKNQAIALGIAALYTTGLFKGLLNPKTKKLAVTEQEVRAALRLPELKPKKAVTKADIKKAEEELKELRKGTKEYKEKIRELRTLKKTQKRTFIKHETKFAAGDVLPVTDKSLAVETKPEAAQTEREGEEIFTTEAGEEAEASLSPEDKAFRRLQRAEEALEKAREKGNKTQIKRAEYRVNKASNEAARLFEEQTGVGERLPLHPLSDDKPPIAVHGQEFKPGSIKSLKQMLTDGKNKYKKEQARIEQEKTRKQNRLIPEEYWWEEAPERGMDLRDPTVQRIAKEHRLYFITNDPETEPWIARSKAIAKQIVISNLITKKEFLELAAEVKSSKGSDLQHKLYDLLDLRSPTGSWVDLLNSIVSTMPNAYDFAEAAFGPFIKKEKSAQAKAKKHWKEKLKKPSEADIIEDAVFEAYHDAEIHATTDPVDRPFHLAEIGKLHLVEVIAWYIGYMSAKAGVKINVKNVMQQLQKYHQSRIPAEMREEFIQYVYETGRATTDEDISILNAIKYEQEYLEALAYDPNEFHRTFTPMAKEILKTTKKVEPVRVPTDTQPTPTANQARTEPGKSTDNPIIGDIWDQDGYKIISTNLGGIHGAGLAAQAKRKGKITYRVNKDFDTSPKDSDVLLVAVKGAAPETQQYKGKMYSESTTGKNVDLMKSELAKLEAHAKAHPDSKYFIPYIGLLNGRGDKNVILPILDEFLQRVPNAYMISINKSAAKKYAGSMIGKATRDAAKSKFPPPSPGESEQAYLARVVPDAAKFGFLGAADVRLSETSGKEREALINVTQASVVWEAAQDKLISTQSTSTVKQERTKPFKPRPGIEAKVYKQIQKGATELELSSAHSLVLNKMLRSLNFKKVKTDPKTRKQIWEKQDIRGSRQFSKQGVEHPNITLKRWGEQLEKQGKLLVFNKETQQYEVVDRQGKLDLKQTEKVKKTVRGVSSSQYTDLADALADSDVKKATDNATEFLLRAFGPEMHRTLELVLIKDTGKTQKERYSGVFEVASGLIRLAVDSLDPLSVAFHEGMHKFAKTLSETEAGQALYQRLEKAASSPFMRKQLKDLLANEPEALKQLDNVHERIAYMFQFWAASRQPGGPVFKIHNTKNLFHLLVRAFARITKIITNSEAAEGIFKAFYSGSFHESGNDVKSLKQYQSKTVKEAIAATYDSLTGGLRAIFSTPITRLKKMNIPSLTKLANMWFADPLLEQGSGVVQRTQQIERQFRVEFRNILTKHKPTKQELKIAGNNLQAMKVPTSPLEKDIDKLFRKLYGYSQEGANPVMRFDGIDEHTKEPIWSPMDKAAYDRYFPRIWDIEAILANEKRFRFLLEKHGGLDDTAINAFIENLRQSDGAVEQAYRAEFSPFMNSVNKRVFDFINPSNAIDFVEFQQQNHAKIIENYIRSMAHRREHARSFGSKGEITKKLLTKARREGATEAQIEYAKKAIQGMEGRLGTDKVSDIQRDFMVTAMSIVNFAVLPLALFSSLVDPLGVHVRTGDLKGAAKTFAAGIRQIINDTRKVKTGGVGGIQELAEYVGAIEEDMAVEIINNAERGVFMNEKLRKANAFFFKAIGLEQWTRGTRIGALQAAIDYLIDVRKTLDKDPTNKLALRKLKELGLEVGDVELRDNRISIRLEEFTGSDRATERARFRRVNNALYRMVDESILRPTAGTRPLWMSDLRFLLLGHLKPFTFTFHNTIVKQVINRMKKERADGATWAKASLAYAPLLSYIPMMMAADMLRNMAAGRWDDDDDEKSFIEMVGNSIQRSGIASYGTFALDIEDDLDYSGLPINTIFGPVAEKTVRLGRGVFDPDVSFLKAASSIIPGHALIRDWLE